MKLTISPGPFSPLPVDSSKESRFAFPAGITGLCSCPPSLEDRNQRITLMAVAILVALGGLCLTLAAYQAFTGIPNVISNLGLGGKVLGFSVMVVGGALPLISLNSEKKMAADLKSKIEAFANDCRGRYFGRDCRRRDMEIPEILSEDVVKFNDYMEQFKTLCENTKCYVTQIHNPATIPTGNSNLDAAKKDLNKIIQNIASCLANGAALFYPRLSQPPPALTPPIPEAYQEWYNEWCQQVVFWERVRAKGG